MLHLISYGGEEGPIAEPVGKVAGAGFGLTSVFVNRGISFFGNTFGLRLCGRTWLAW